MMNLFLKTFCLSLFLWAVTSFNTNAQPPAKNREAAYFDAIKAIITDKPSQALPLLKKYTEENPTESAGFYYLSTIQAKEGSSSDAKRSIKKAIELEPSNKWYQERYAYILAQEKKYAEAADIFAQLAESDRINDEYLMKAAILYSSAKKDDEAVEMIDKLIKKGGYDEDLMLRKYQIFMEAKNFSKAEKVLRDMIAADPKAGKNYSILADFFMTRKELPNAKKVLDEAILKFPDDFTLQLALAQYYQSMGDSTKYDEVVKKTITNENLDAGTQVSLLIPYLQQLSRDTSKRKEGIALARKLSAQHPNNADIQTLFGDILSFENLTDSAAVQYKKALAIDQTKFAIWQQIMFSYTAKDKADSLIKYSEDAILLFPNQSMAHYLNGIGKYNKQEYLPAVKAVNRAIDLQADENDELLSDMHSMLGDIYNANKNYTQSDESYETALRLNPKNASVLNNYAYYLSLRKTKLDLAERMSKKSLELRPDEATFLDTYGWILFQQGKYEEAKKYIEQAIEANPNADGTLFEHLGDIYFKLNKKDKALGLWQQAQQKGVDEIDLLKKKIKDKQYYE